MKKIAILISDEFRTLPYEWWEKLEGPKPTTVDEFITSNGCTASPDWHQGIAIWPACYIHDFHYSDEFYPLGWKWASRREADAIFRRNIERLFEWQHASFWQKLYVPILYWAAVRKAGKFAWGPGETPVGRVQKWLEKLGWFKDKR